MGEGRVRWAFWPPETDPSILSEAGDGIWISSDDDAAGVDLESDGEEEEVEQDRASESDGGDGEIDEEVEDEGEDEDEEGPSIGGRFGALALEDGVTESTEEE